MKRALRASLPVLAGYIPMGAAFGFVFTRELGLPWHYAGLSGLVVYAGAAQFLSIGLLAAGAGMLEVFTATFLLNLRHVFYGLSLMNRLPERGLRRFYSIFGLTDETYAVLSGRRLPGRGEDEAFCFELTALDHLYWTAGCALGGLAAGRSRLDLEGLDFILTALFLVLAVEQALAVRAAGPFLLAAGAAAAALLVWPGQMLAVSLGAVAAVLLAQSFREGGRHD